MRVLLAVAIFVSCACQRAELTFNWAPEMTADQMLDRASLVFIGVIEDHQLEPKILFHWTPQPGAPAGDYWRVARRRVRVETVLRGAESRKTVDVYEIFWTGGTTGDWNSTQDGERALFMVHVDNGRYHIVRDWSRSIFPITTGPHDRLPLDNSHPLWERIALLNFWIPSSDPSERITYPQFRYIDPGNALGMWRILKLYRGLVRHPSPGVRVPACRALLELSGWGQDECWESLSESDREHLRDGGYMCCTAQDIAKMRDAGDSSQWMWQHFDSIEHRRRLTAMNNARLRAEFCRLWEREYPDDHDNGCPADRPPPATIVTINGDVPLPGAWPH